MLSRHIKLWSMKLVSVVCLILAIMLPRSEGDQLRSVPSMMSKNYTSLLLSIHHDEIVTFIFEQHNFNDSQGDVLCASSSGNGSGFEPCKLWKNVVDYTWQALNDSMCNITSSNNITVLKVKPHSLGPGTFAVKFCIHDYVIFFPLYFKNESTIYDYFSTTVISAIAAVAGVTVISVTIVIISCIRYHTRVKDSLPLNQMPVNAESELKQQEQPQQEVILDERTYSELPAPAASAMQMYPERPNVYMYSEACNTLPNPPPRAEPVGYANVRDHILSPPPHIADADATAFHRRYPTLQRTERVQAAILDRRKSRSVPSLFPPQPALRPFPRLQNGGVSPQLTGQPMSPEKFRPHFPTILDSLQESAGRIRYEEHDLDTSSLSEDADYIKYEAQQREAGSFRFEPSSQPRSGARRSDDGSGGYATMALDSPTPPTRSQTVSKLPVRPKLSVDDHVGNRNYENFNPMLKFHGRMTLPR